MSFLTRVITVVAALSSIALGAPLSLSLKQRQSSDPSCVKGVKRIYTPELFNIYYYPNVPSFPSTSTVLNIMNGSSSGSAQDQVVRWANIPAGVQNCRIGYHQAADRSFSVYNNGLVRFSQMSGLPSAGTAITAQTIPPFIVAGAKGGAMDFTFWPEVVGPFDHVGGAVDCGADVIVKLTKDMVNGGAGSVTMQQSEGNGLWLEHSC